MRSEDTYLGWQATTSPCSTQINVLVEAFSEHLLKVSQIVLVFLADISDGNSGAGLLVDQCSQSGLALNDAVRDVQFTAERWKVNDELNCK
jgi:hypothetical protein